MFATNERAGKSSLRLPAFFVVNLGMIRKAFKMSVYPDQHAEYARRHHPIWRELEETLLASGVRTYSIFLDPPTGELFAYVEVESEERWKAIAQTEVCRRWWKHMREIMPSNPDNSPVSHELSEVFHIQQ
jgi:L-rhamnose mutarotase